MVLNNEIKEQESQSGNKWKRWLKKIGVLGFLFFLIKGLVWLAIFYFVGDSIF